MGGRRGNFIGQHMEREANLQDLGCTITSNSSPNLSGSCPGKPAQSGSRDARNWMLNTGSHKKKRGEVPGLEKANYFGKIGIIMEVPREQSGVGRFCGGRWSQSWDRYVKKKKQHEAAYSGILVACSKKQGHLCQSTPVQQLPMNVITAVKSQDMRPTVT